MSARERLFELVLRYVDSEGRDFVPFEPEIEVMHFDLALSHHAVLSPMPAGRDARPRRGRPSADDILERARRDAERTDEGFSETLLRLIRERGMTEVECYTRANVDRRLFSKIRSDRGYRPKKETALAFAVALELDEEGADALLRTAGFALSGSSRFDRAVRYCIRARVRNIHDINYVLHRMDLPILRG